MKHFRVLTILSLATTILSAVPAFADSTCSWVGSASSCRDREVGSYCSDDEGYAGVCATTYWDRCTCAKISRRSDYEFDEYEAPVRIAPRYRRRSPRVLLPAPHVVLPVPGVSINLPGFSLDFN